MKLVLPRQGESIWNLDDRFTGWTDVDLCKVAAVVPTTNLANMKHMLWRHLPGE